MSRSFSQAELVQEAVKEAADDVVGEAVAEHVTRRRRKTKPLAKTLEAVPVEERAEQVRFRQVSKS